MKKIPLTQGKYALVDDEDFEYLNQYYWQINGRYVRTAIYVKGSGRKNQKQIRFSMHGLLMRPPINKVIDHIDGNPLNNQKFNLRICTQAENCRNNKRSKNNLSGYTGIHFSKRENKWMASIMVNRKNIFLGYYTDKRAGWLARRLGERLYFKEFSNYA